MITNNEILRNIIYKLENKIESLENNNIANNNITNNNITNNNVCEKCETPSQLFKCNFHITSEKNKNNKNLCDCYFGKKHHIVCSKCLTEMNIDWLFIDWLFIDWLFIYSPGAK